MKAELKIADILLNITGNCSEDIVRSMDKYMVPTDSHVRDDMINIDIQITDRIDAIELEQVYGVRNYIEESGLYGDRYISQDRDGRESYATLLYSKDFKHVTCMIKDVETEGGSSLASRIKVAIGECFLNCLPAFGGVTFHSSAIRYNDQALLFAAPSGTGKSTHTGLWKKVYGNVAYINDDTPIIRRKNGVLYAWGAPWAGTSGINNNIAAPVKAIVYLKRAAENSVRALTGRDRILRGLCSVRGQSFPPQRKKQAELLSDIMSEIPVYELCCNISEEAVRLVHSVLF